MSEYARIERRIWNSPTFRKLSEDGQRLWFYILTCPHGNILGTFIFKFGYVTEDLNWGKDQLSKALSEVLSIGLSNGDKGLVKYDAENKLLFIRNHFEEGRNPITNSNQEKGAIKKLKELPNSPLLKDLKDRIEALYKDRYKDLLEALSEALCNTVSVSVSEPLKKQEHENTPLEKEDKDAPLESDQSINNSLIEERIEDIKKSISQLVKRDIFNPWAFDKKNESKHPEARLQVLTRAKQEIEKKNQDFLKEPYRLLTHIMKVEHQNANERVGMRDHDVRKLDEIEFARIIDRGGK